MCNFRDSNPKEDFRTAEVVCYTITRKKSQITGSLVPILYLIDMGFYEKYEEQLMGLKYIKTEVGVDICKKNYETPETSLNLCSGLSDKEKEVVKLFVNKFLGKGKEDINTYIRSDLPWMATPVGEVISYEGTFYRDDRTSILPLLEGGSFIYGQFNMGVWQSGGYEKIFQKESSC